MSLIYFLSSIFSFLPLFFWGGGLRDRLWWSLAAQHGKTTTMFSSFTSDLQIHSRAGSKLPYPKSVISWKTQHFLHHSRAALGHFLEASNQLSGKETWEQRKYSLVYELPWSQSLALYIFYYYRQWQRWIIMHMCRTKLNYVFNSQWYLHTKAFFKYPWVCSTALLQFSIVFETQSSACPQNRRWLRLIQNFCFKIIGLTQPICTKVTTGVSSVHKLPGHHDCYEFALLPKASLYVPSLLLPKDAVLLYVILTNRQ